MTAVRATQALRGLLRCTALATLGAGVLLGAPAARADDGTATVRLIQLLIQKGVLTQDQAASLLKQAQDESRGKPKAAAKPAAAAAAMPEPEPPPPAEAAPPAGVRVTYVPQIVREQIAGEVRQQVMQQAKAEGWAAPNAAPEWTKRLKFYGDVRLRGEQALLDKNNNPITDFNSINNSAGGFDTSTGALPPSLNSTQNRNRYRLRARLGMQAQIDDWVTADIMVATGSDNSPVSTNQTLGSSGGDFSKYALWLNRAYIGLAPYKSLKMAVGRAPNPFWTTDLMYSDELNFDGVSISDTIPINGMLDVFASAGAFTVFNTDFNFSSVNTPKFASHDKYLFGAQAGANLRPVENVAAKAAAGFFAYTNIDGKLSAPCTILQTNFGCPTDATRAQFVQNGNTLFNVRNIATTATSSATPSFFGLASRFDIFDLHGRVDYTGFRVPLALEGEFSKNLAFDRKAIAGRSPVTNLDSNGNFVGGDTAYLMKLTLGKTDVAEKWDWNAFVAYKYLESDAVLDALTDSNFHLGGTNAKGYMLGGNLGLAHNLYLSAKWFSATEISGLAYSNDLVQIDLNARF